MQFFLVLLFHVEAAILQPNCLELQGAACVSETVITQTVPLLSQNGLIGYWSFDEEGGVDSIHALTIDPSPSVGPGVLGFGASAFFEKREKSDTKQKHYIISHLSLPNHEWSVSMWIFLLPHNPDAFVSILHKGDKLFPQVSFLLWPHTPRLRVKFGDTSIDTLSTLTLARWTQITITKASGIGSVYVNGVLDTQMILGKVPLSNNDETLYVGGSEGQHSVHAYLDELRFYNRALSTDETRALASFAFPSQLGGGSLPSLGCNRCSLQRAMSVCGSKVDSHLCSTHELRSSALLVSRTLGWTTLYHSNHPGEPAVEMIVWNHEQGALLHHISPPTTDIDNSTQTSSSSFSGRVGYGLCCPDH